MLDFLFDVPPDSLSDFPLYLLLCAFAAGDKPSQMRITHQLLMNALRETRPSVTASERQRYDRMQVIYLLLRYPCPM